MHLHVGRRELGLRSAEKCAAVSALRCSMLRPGSRRGAILDRRSVLEVVFSGALISPCFAQPRQLRRIGFLSESSPDAGNVLLHEFENALWALGYIEGGNLVLERRFSGGFPERSTAQARELVASQVDVLVASGNAATAAAMKATSTLPIVMLNTVEPVPSGLVLSLAKPGRKRHGSNAGCERLPRDEATPTYPATYPERDGDRLAAFSGVGSSGNVRV